MSGTSQVRESDRSGGTADAMPLTLTNVWRMQVRAGLADMMTQAASSVTGEVPETLALDAARLHAAQNGFQLLVVQATCLLLLAQMQGGRPLANAQGETSGQPLSSLHHAVEDSQLHAWPRQASEAPQSQVSAWRCLSTGRTAGLQIARCRLPAS